MQARKCYFDYLIDPRFQEVKERFIIGNKIEQYTQNIILQL